jgi:hypothetical protein
VVSSLAARERRLPSARLDNRRGKTVTIKLTKEQMKMLTPLARKGVAYENAMRKHRTITLLMKDEGDEEFHKMRSVTWSSETTRRDLRAAIEMQRQHWQQNVYHRATFKIVDTGEQIGG